MFAPPSPPPPPPPPFSIATIGRLFLCLGICVARASAWVLFAMLCVRAAARRWRASCGSRDIEVAGRAGSAALAEDMCFKRFSRRGRARQAIRSPRTSFLSDSLAMNKFSGNRELLRGNCHVVRGAGGPGQSRPTQWPNFLGASLAMDTCFSK